MTRSEVAVATRNPKTLFLIMEVLKGLDLDFIVCESGGVECQVAKVIITTSDEARNLDPERVVIVEDNLDEDSMVIALMLHLLDIEKPTSIIVGVDPGMRFGLALVIDGNVIRTRISSSPGKAAQFTLRWLAAVSDIFSQKPVIRVGTGSSMFAAFFLREIIPHVDRTLLELVNEEKSDKSSAILIAMRQGRPVKESDDSFEIRESHVQSLKHLVLDNSNGTKRVSTADAQAVLQGDKSLEWLLGSSD
jgi:hypothetical protein